jgi:hypothetical protein
MSRGICLRSANQDYGDAVYEFMGERHAPCKLGVEDVKIPIGLPRIPPLKALLNLL